MSMSTGIALILFLIVQFIYFRWLDRSAARWEKIRDELHEAWSRRHEP